MADPLTYANSDEYVLVNPSDPKVGHLIYDAPMVDAETKQFIRDPETGKIKVYRMVIWGTKGLTQAQVESLISQNNVTLTTKINNLESTVTNFLDADDTTLDQLSELITEIKANKANIGLLVSGKATKEELQQAVNTINTNLANYMDLASAQTVTGNKTFTGTVEVPTVTSSDNSTKAASTAFVQTKVSEVQSSITTINNTLNTVLDSDDESLNQLSELVTEIKNNKTNIASLVSDKATKAELAEVANKSNAITVSDTAPNVANMPVASGVMHPAQNIITENPDVSILALQQSMWAYNATRDYAVGSFVIYNNSIYQCLVANGPSSTVANPSNVVYWTQIPTMEDLKNKFVPTGTILLYAGSVLPDSYLGCQGAPFDPVTYADLYAKIGTTYGGTAESPLLPDFRDRYPIGAGTNALGTYISEQLPNITGTFQGGYKENSAISGAFSFVGSANHFTWSGSSADPEFAINSFEASRSNSIYTDNGKVLPLSIALNFIIKT